MKPLRSSAARDLLARIPTDLKIVERHWAHAYDITINYTPGYPAGGIQPGSRPSGHGDPTPQRATTTLENPRQELSDKLTLAAKLLRELATETVTLAQRTPTTKPEPECAQCSALNETGNYYANITDQNGKRTPVCSWHYDFWTNHQQWPHPTLVRHHAAGRHIDNPQGRALMRTHHPDIYEQLTKTPKPRNVSTNH